jgi:hypothetical protein
MPRWRKGVRKANAGAPVRGALTCPSQPLNGRSEGSSALKAVGLEEWANSRNAPQVGGLARGLKWTRFDGHSTAVRAGRVRRAVGYPLRARSVLQRRAPGADVPHLEPTCSTGQAKNHRRSFARASVEVRCSIRSRASSGSVARCMAGLALGQRPKQARRSAIEAPSAPQQRAPFRGPWCRESV